MQPTIIYAMLIQHAQVTIGYVNTIPTMQILTRLSRNEQSQAYEVSMSWEFQNNVLSDTFNMPYTHNGHEYVLRFIRYCLSCDFSSLDSLLPVYSEWTYSSSLRSGELEVTPPHTQQPLQQLTQKSDTK